MASLINRVIEDLPRIPLTRTRFGIRFRLRWWRTFSTTRLTANPAKPDTSVPYKMPFTTLPCVLLTERHDVLLNVETDVSLVSECVRVLEPSGAKLGHHR